MIVSIHAPAWGATEDLFIEMEPLPVSIHAPAWGATRWMQKLPRRSALFQSTHPRGVRLAAPPPLASINSRFNPRTRVGCDPGRASSRPHARACFNPRTRVGCDLSLCVIPSPRLVSIHAPAWGATGSRQSVSYLTCVSIHAPAWGATARPMFCPTSCRFQSTHPRGVRPAPAPPAAWKWPSFNPRTRVGCDLCFR